jgi:hypothetical protein
MGSWPAPAGRDFALVMGLSALLGTLSLVDFG